MLSDAFAALIFGFLFDKIGVKTLIISTLVSLTFSIFIFSSSNFTLIFIGIILWGIGMGAQESILKAAVAKLVKKNQRAAGYGLFYFCFGFFWFVGSVILGIVYEKTISGSFWIFIFLSVIMQVSSLPFFVLASGSDNAKKKMVQ